MNMLTKKDILKDTPLKSEVVEVPELGGSVRVQEMTALARDAFDSFVLDRDDGDYRGTRVQVFIGTVVDEEGKLMFTRLDGPDLLLKSGEGINKVAEVGMRLSGLGEKAEASLVKNSEADQKEDSTSD